MTSFINDTGNWSRVQSFLNGSPTYANGEAALAAGTDGAFLEDYYFLLRGAVHIVPTTEELLYYGVWDVPLYGQAFGAGFLVGTALDKWLHISSAVASLFDSRTVAPWSVAQCDWAFNPSTAWRLMCSAVPGDYGWSTDNFPDPDCSTQYHTCFNPVTGAPNDSATWNSMSQIARMVNRGTNQAFLDGSGNPRFRRVMTRAQMAAEFHGDSSLQPYTGQPKVKDVPIGTPLNVSPTSPDATNAKNQLLANPEAAQGAAWVIIHEAPYSGDPDVPPPPIVDWTMPNCTGYQAVDCQALVTAAASAAHNPAPSFSSVTGTGDAALMPGAVTSQSVPAGTSGRPSSIVLTLNPDPLNGIAGGGGYNGDDGSSTTGSGDEECDFDDYAMPPAWHDVFSENPSYYEQECRDAWAAARAAGYVDAFNNPTPDWVATAKWAVPGRYFTDETIIDELTANGSNIGDWVKVKSPLFETAHGEAEMHLYKNIETGAVYLGRGWKLVFKGIF